MSIKMVLDLDQLVIPKQVIIIIETLQYAEYRSVHVVEKLLNYKSSHKKVSPWQNESRSAIVSLINTEFIPIIVSCQPKESKVGIVSSYTNESSFKMVSQLQNESLGVIVSMKINESLL